MGYELRKRKNKAGEVRWLLYHRSIKDGVKTDSYIPTSALLQHGFHPDMDIEDARSRVSQLNGLKGIERREEARKVRILAQAREREALKSAHLPEHFLEEFEQVWLKEQVGVGINGYHKYQKALSHWAYTKRLIANLKLPVEEYRFKSRLIYDYFRRTHISYEYSRKVLRVINLWGVFVSRKMHVPFLEVKTPGKVDREAINDAWHEAGHTTTASLPLTPEALEAAKLRFKTPQYNWLFVSVWFGLRPEEIERIKRPNHFRVEKDKEGTTIVWIYQPKLTSLARDKRYKGIPCIYSEQLKALSIIQNELLAKPLVKSIQKHIGPGINTRGGRKGFTDLMLQRGQSLEDISMWLGHQSVDMTFKRYKDKQQVRYKKPA